MLSRKRIDEIAAILADAAVDAAAGYAADKAVDSVLEDDKEEDAEEMTPGTTTPTGTATNTQPPAGTVPTAPEEKDEEPDPLVDQVIKLVQQYKDKQVSDAQMDYAYRQNQANKIVSDIEEFIKNNTKK
jgi:hypothetical protein